ncbi:MAG: hypothetical protein JO000_03245 [Alphaproteobacteria bacterium]|nr:hypothetical protein [Alphaproteobacteria bacterium]
MGEDRIVRITARLYAILSALGGAAILAFVGVLISAFGARGIFEPKFFAFIIAPGIAGLALAPFLWMEKVWAMALALAVALMLTFLFSLETLFMRIVLPGTTALFAVFTGVQLWLGRKI